MDKDKPKFLLKDDGSIEKYNASTDSYYRIARIDENSRILYDGDIPANECIEIEEFLHTQGAHLYPDGHVYKLVN